MGGSGIGHGETVFVAAVAHGFGGDGGSDWAAPTLGVGAGARKDRHSVPQGEAREWLIAALAGKPGLTMRGLAAEMDAPGTRVAHDKVWFFAKAARLSVKKTLIASEQLRPKVPRFRARGKAHQYRQDPKCLILLDETLVKTNMTPT